MWSQNVHIFGKILAFASQLIVTNSIHIGKSWVEVYLVIPLQMHRVALSFFISAKKSCCSTIGAINNLCKQYFSKIY